MTDPLSAAGLCFQAYWRRIELRCDFRILVNCGQVQASCVASGTDCPAGWFATAARTYPDSDEVGVLARRTCELVAAAFAGGRAS